MIKGSSCVQESTQKAISHSYLWEATASRETSMFQVENKYMAYLILYMMLEIAEEIQVILLLENMKQIF